MTQPRPTYENLHGIEVANRFYPESGLSIAEYHDGDILIQVTRSAGEIVSSINARFENPGQTFGLHDNEADFERLQLAYLAACERHGVVPREGNRDFYFRTRGHGVLWSGGTVH